MPEQEFIAFSLPYGLQIINTRFGEIHPITQIEFHSNIVSNNDKMWCHFNQAQPIVRNISDLTKPIEHNGEKLVPIVELAKMRSSIVENVIPMAFEAIKRDIKSKRLPFDMVLKLIEWHFDIANLIESGEAIDINTLETNPYK